LGPQMTWGRRLRGRRNWHRICSWNGVADGMGNKWPQTAATTGRSFSHRPYINRPQQQQQAASAGRNSIGRLQQHEPVAAAPAIATALADCSSISSPQQHQQPAAALAGRSSLSRPQQHHQAAAASAGRSSISRPHQHQQAAAVATGRSSIGRPCSISRP
jgi:hypothetical protein